VVYEFVTQDFLDDTKVRPETAENHYKKELH